MKKIYLSILSFFVVVVVMAQTPGFTYQAVILNPETQSFPGNDVAGLLSESDITIRFTIENEVGTEYQETHTTKTDAYGMVSLMVGQGSAIIGNFIDISWFGAEKYLKVEIDFTASGSNYELLDRQALTYLPQPLSLASNNRINELELAINTVAADLTSIQLTPGPQGNDGNDGVDGLAGADGTNGIAGTNGVDGIDGINGTNGDNGIQGTAGNDGNDGTNGVDGIDGAVGVQGLQGISGNDGNDGTNGVDGIDGAVGVQGLQGIAGNDGIDGTNGVDGAVGAQGLQGIAGNDGTNGANGTNGTDGIGIAQNLSFSGDTIFITDGQYIVIPGLSWINSLIGVGCTDSLAINYNPLAITDNGSCIISVIGCTDSTAINYDPLANTDDGTCIVNINFGN